jgi:hypothetical protein
VWNLERNLSFSVSNKMFTRIILHRIQVHVNPVVRNEQAGFRKHRSCVDQINTLRRISEENAVWNTQS